MRRLATILSLFCLSASMAFAGPDTTGFIHFSINNGFPTNNVYSLVQDRNGFLWFATDNGIVKYNGYKFDIYNTDRGIPSNDVWELHEDNAGRMWFQSFSYEFGFLKNGKYKHIHYSAEGRIVQPQFLTNVGSMLAFTESTEKGMNLIFAGDDLIKVVPFYSGVGHFGHGQGGEMRRYMISERFGISFCTTDGRLLQLKRNKKGFDFVEHCHVPDELLYLYSSKIGFSPSNEAYIFKMYGKGSYKYDIEKCRYDSLSLVEMGADPSERVYAQVPYFLQNSKVPRSVLITNSHLYTISSDYRFLSRTRNSDLLPTEAQIAYIYTDKYEHLWYTTNGDGVWSTSGENGFYETIGKMPELQDARFIGSIGNKLYWWDSKKLRMFELVKNKITKTIEMYSNMGIKSISGNDSVAYLSTAASIYEYNVRTGEVRNVKDIYKLRSYIFNSRSGGDVAKENELSVEQMRTIKFIGHDIYGLGAFGLVEYHFSGDTIISRRLDTERYLGIFYKEKEHVRCCYSSRRISLSNVVTGANKILGEKQLDRLGIGSVRQMEMDNLGNIFLLDDKNIFICDSSFKKLRKIAHNFLVSDAFIRICNDRLFVAGKFGLAYLQIRGKDAVDDFHIIPNRALSYFKKLESFQLSDDGYAVLKTNEGTSGFHVDSLIGHATTGQRTDLFDLVLLSPVESRVRANDTLSFNQDAEKMSFDVINFYGTGAVKYTFKIAGRKDQEESSSGEIFLGSLEAGTYYQVVCKIRDDMWESDPRVFYIYRTPFWWQTTKWKTIFWITGVLLFLGLVLITILTTRYFVAKKNERRRALVELELRAIHSQINPHFIFNTLSASLFFINKKRFDDAYNHVNKFSKLLRSYLKSSQDRYVILEEEVSMLRNYIDLQQIRFEEKFEYFIEVDNKLPLNNIRIPSLLLQPLVENAINHGLFHKGEGGKLTLKFLQGTNSTELICVIDDNGIGREAAKKINDTNRTKESYGTKLTNQLLDVFKQYEHFDIRIEYTDKVLPEMGTVVTLTLKNIEYVA